MMEKIALIALFATITNAQVIGLGPCPSVTVVQEFDVAAYLGQWYQIARFPNPFEFGNCSSALYGPVNEDGTVQVLNKEIVDGEESSISGTAELANSNSTEAKLIVKFGVEGVNQTVSDYWVLGTDYTNYTVVYTCIETDNNLFNVQASWILGRQKPLSQEAYEAIQQILLDNDVDITKYTVNDLPECKNLP